MSSNTYKFAHLPSYYTAELSKLKLEMNQELESILKFWEDHVIDFDNKNGFVGKINIYGIKFVESSISCVLATRLLWTFSAAYRFTKKKNYKSVADHIFSYLVNYFYDKKNGGLYWELDSKGLPINKRKQAYALGFGIYAFSEYNRATKNINSLNIAKELYNDLESKFWDSNYLGYIEALTNDWQPIDDMRLSDKDINAPKSMNTHLHIIEPYTNLYRVWPNINLKERIEKLLQIFTTKIVDAKTGHFNLFFDIKWNPVSTAISFGHDIEGAWLLHEAAVAVGNKVLVKEIQKLSIKLVNLTIEKGIDKDGALFNELDNGYLDKEKHWWPQAEAIVGYIDAYQITKDSNYLKLALKNWKFITNHIIDHKNGEWFWRIDATGKPNIEDDKIGFWKCPYHNSRALMEVVCRIDECLN